MGPPRRRLADRDVAVVDLPGHGGSAGSRPDLSTPYRPSSNRRRRAVYVGYSLGGRRRCTSPSAPRLGDGLVLLGATAGIEDARRTRRPAGRATTRLAASIEPDGVEHVPRRVGWPGRCSPASRRSAPTSPTAFATPPPGWPSSLRPAGTGTQDPLVGSARRADDAGAGGGRRRDDKFRRARRGMAAAVGRTPVRHDRRRRSQRPPGAARRVPRRCSKFLRRCHRPTSGAQDPPPQPPSARPSANAAPNTSCSRPVPPSTAMSSRPMAPRRTVRTGGATPGAPTTARRARPGRRLSRAPRRSRRATRDQRRVEPPGARSPRRTARVRLPASRSVGMSRRLLTTSSAQARQPTGTLAASASPVSRSAST